MTCAASSRSWKPASCLRRSKRATPALSALRRPALPDPTYDCLVVGAGPAGLSAALMLGRCRRRVLVCDTGEARNRWSDAVHGFLTRDGTPPATVLASCARATAALQHRRHTDHPSGGRRTGRRGVPRCAAEDGLGRSVAQAAAGDGRRGRAPGDRGDRVAVREECASLSLLRRMGVAGPAHREPRTGRCRRGARRDSGSCPISLAPDAPESVEKLWGFS